MKNNIKELIREHIPNTPLIVDLLTKQKIKSLNRYSLSPQQISLGEKDNSEKKRIVGACTKKWKKYSDKFNKKTDEYFLLIPDKIKGKDLEELRVDILFDHFAYGFMPEEYFSFHLEGKTQEQKKEYISDRDRFIYTYKLNNILELGMFFDKYKVYQKYSEFYKRDVICLSSRADYKKFCCFTKKHPVFVRKKIGMSRGKGVSLIRADKTKQSRQELFDSLISQGRMILEEPIIQSKEMSYFNEDSVNTVRCPTLLTKKGVELAPCRFRIGHKGSFVDNSGSGGISVSVDKASGILDSNGWDEYCNEYERHPETDRTFKGYQLPEWDLLVRTVTKMALMTPAVRYISWDMAHTDKGWVVVEANGQGQFIGVQINQQRGVKKEILEQLEGIITE